ncbi:MAG: hydrolase 2, exosortase A system-associated [Gammaproteobacteria bacterium]|nr:hydrolase 2, exosortase A system-associated [Gammaproteobacteria bacterium]
MRPHLYFLGTSHGDLLITEFSPDSLNDRLLNLIVVPPFCEEMNKSRKMIADFSRLAAKNNITVSVIDLFGTGDSAGELAEATWEIWQDNLVAMVNQLKDSMPEIPIAMLGIRTGALLALDCCITNKMSLPNSLMMWQPVLNGQQFINQFMRLRLAAEMMSASTKVTMADLMTELEQTSLIEIAGYTVNKSLVDALISLNYQKLEQLPPRLKLSWFEVGLAPKTNLLPISQKLIERWQQAHSVHSEFISGDVFWQTQEITTAEILSQRSVERLLGSLNE